MMGTCLLLANRKTLVLPFFFPHVFYSIWISLLLSNFVPLPFPYDQVYIIAILLANFTLH